MDARVSDLQDRLARLAREEERLNAELKELTAPLSGATAGEKPAGTALTGESLAKYNWIESRLGEIQAWKHQITEKLAKVEWELPPRP
jgi:chromosome segregation ATPase